MSDAAPSPTIGLSSANRRLLIGFAAALAVGPVITIFLQSGPLFGPGVAGSLAAGSSSSVPPATALVGRSFVSLPSNGGLAGEAGFRYKDRPSLVPPAG